MYNIETIRMGFIACLSALLGFVAPIEANMYAWLVAFAFNIVCGLRADGCSITSCATFSQRKFSDACVQLLVFASVALVIFIITELMATEEAARLAVVTLSWVYIYFNISNGLKNLRKAYPRSMVILMIYYVIRLELSRALPTHVREVVERVNKEVETKQIEENGNK